MKYWIRIETPKQINRCAETILFHGVSEIDFVWIKEKYYCKKGIAFRSSSKPFEQWKEIDIYSLTST